MNRDPNVKVALPADAVKSIEELGLEVCPRREEMPDERSIGGTTVAAIVGLSPYRSPFDVWLQLTGKAPKREEANAGMRWGSRLEPAVLEAYRDEVNSLSAPCPTSFRLKARPHLRLSPDGLADPSIVVEAKTARWKGAGWGESESDEIPPVYLAQVTWYCHFLQRSAWDLPALFGGSLFECFRGAYDADLGAWLEEEAERFWTKHVLADIPPESMEGSLVDRYLRERFPHAERKTLDPAPPFVATMVARRARFDLAAAYVERERDKVTDALKLAIGSGAGFAGEGFKVRWSDVESQRIDWKAVAAAFIERFPEQGKALVPLHTKPSSYRRFTVNASEEFLAAQLTEAPAINVPLSLPPAEED